MAKTGDIVSRVYSKFRGVDFRGEEIDLSRSPDSVNMWKDYRETDSIRTRPALSLSESFDDTVYGIFFYCAGGRELMLVHSGTKLYRCEGPNKTLLYSGLNEAKSDSFIYNNVWYFKDGKNYLQYDGAYVKAVEGYVPTTSVGRKPSGAGTAHEDVNLLTRRRINTFSGDGISRRYFLDEQNIDTDFAPIVTVNSKLVTNYTVDYAQGIINFTSAPPISSPSGQDNVTVEFGKTVAGYGSRIEKCTLLSVFDNRIFFSGNEDFPNTVWHCSLNDPTYCSALDFYNDGLDTAEIRGLVAGNNALWVFREPSLSNTTVFYHVPTIDSKYGKIYPSTHSSIATGCIGRAINFGDDIVFFSDTGMEGVTGDIESEQVIEHRSSLVDRKLLSEAGYKDMLLEEWEGYLIVFVGNKAYLADSRSSFKKENHTEYDWFYWSFDKVITSVKVNSGILYIGTKDGVYTLTDMSGNVESCWVTPKDRFDMPQKQKTANKKGFVAEAVGDISVYAKTESSDFELVGKYENVKDYFVSKMKFKKFKDIQLKFCSSKRFSLEHVTLECFIGGYIKR